MWKLSTYCFAIIGFVTFVGDCARGILSAVLWSICHYTGGNRVDLGYLVAIFSIGRLVASLPMGMLTDIYRHRIILIISNSILLAGSVLWGNVIIAGGLPTLFIAQFLLGLGTGTLGVTRSFVVEQTILEMRTYRLSRLSALQYAGFAATPLLGSALYVAGGNISIFFQFSFPTYFLSGLAFLCILFLYYPFVDIEELDRQRRLGYDPVPSSLGDEETAVTNNSIHQQDETGEGKTAAEGASAGVAAGAEAGEEKEDAPQNDAATTETATDEATKEKARRQEAELSSSTDNKQEEATTAADTLSTATTATASATKVEFLNFIQHQRNQVFHYMIFLNFTTRGILAIYETQIAATLLDDYHLSELQVGFYISLAGILGTFHFLFLKEIWYTNYYGCHHHHQSSWTDYQLMFYGLLATFFVQSLVIIWGKQHSIPLAYVLFSLIFVYGIGYPVTNSAVLGCFSKLQPTGRQATMQSYFALYGSLARIIFPIISGYVVGNDHVESVASFSLVMFLVAVSLLGLVVFEDTIHYLIGLQEGEIKEEEDDDEGSNNDEEEIMATTRTIKKKKKKMKKLFLLWQLSYSSSKNKNDDNNNNYYCYYQQIMMMIINGCCQYYSLSQWCWIGFFVLTIAGSFVILLLD